MVRDNKDLSMTGVGRRWVVRDNKDLSMTGVGQEVGG